MGDPHAQLRADLSTIVQRSIERSIRLNRWMLAVGLTSVALLSAWGGGYVGDHWAVIGIWIALVGERLWQVLERRRADDDRTLSLIRRLPVDTPAPAQPEEGGRHG